MFTISSTVTITCITTSNIIIHANALHHHIMLQRVASTCARGMALLI